jgi:hypothetical protein
MNDAFIANEVRDIPSSYLGEFVKLLFDKVHQEVLGRPKLSAKELNFFEAEVQTFDENLKKILANKDKHQREMALRAVMSALCLSYYHAGGPQILREIKGQFQKERTKKANLGRSRPDIQEIIERRARESWQCGRGIDPPSITAYLIRQDVLQDISKLPKVPKCWQLDPTKPIKAEEKRIEENLRKRIAGIQRLDK